MEKHYFYLRIVDNKTRREFNYSIGKKYSIRDLSDQSVKIKYYHEELRKDGDYIGGFIPKEDSEDRIIKKIISFGMDDEFILDNQEAYIMLENGKTYQKI